MDRDDSSMCGFYVFTFAHNYVNMNQNYRKSTHIDKHDEIIQ
jgi:hypothetical protein